jgi:photosystem II stability/assembly factor-like uncharacterized protein
MGGPSLNAQNWERRGPEGGLVLSLAVSSQGAVYLGTSDGHIFASEDGGGQWELRGRAGTRTDAVVAQLAADPREPRRVFAAVWFREAGAGGGVFRSEDGGVTWSASGLAGEVVRALEFAPSQPGTLVAGTRSGVFRSKDTGRTWERISPAGNAELRNVDSLAIDPADPGLIYAGTYHLPWKTTDGGKSWTPAAAGLIDDSDIMSIRVDAANPARLYASACSGIYRSENRGAAWTKLQGIPYAARRTQAIVQDPRNPATLYAATTEGLWITRDAGERWERDTPREWVVNAAVVVPARGGRPARVLIGTEAQGVLASEDSGKTFAPANRGFTHQVVKQLAGDWRDPAHVLLLLESSAAEILESRDAGKTWKALPMASGMAARKDRWNAAEIERIYGSPWGWLAQLRDASLWSYSEQAQDWQRWNAGYTSAGKTAGKRAGAAKTAWHAAAPEGAGVAFSNEDAYLALSDGLLRCPRSGKCERLAGFPRAAKISALWVSQDGRLLAVADAAGKLGVSHDAGGSAVWRDLPEGLQSAAWVLWSGGDRAPLYLGTKRGLFLSRDAGESWALYRDGLPATFVEKMLCGKNYFLVTLAQGGVYRSASRFADWQRQDRDAERSRMAGMVEVGPGEVLLGSQSEGVLYWHNPEERAETFSRNGT